MSIDVRFWEVAFWIAAGVGVYVYAAYPVVVTLWGRLIQRPIRKSPIQPTVTLLIAAYNEADVIGAKIANARELEYPPGKLDVVIASDGSTDGTAEIASRIAAELDGEPKVRVIAYATNRGKLAVLNETIPLVRGDIVAFSDASSMLVPAALRHLVESFADPSVGAVSGVYRVTRKDETQLGRQEDLYWRYETYLKAQEARLGSVLGAHGALYAVRKLLYPFPQAGTINDDYVIPLRILQRGYRVAYEPRAVAYEEAHEMKGFSRRVRIMTGNIQQLRELPHLMRPPRPLPLFVFLSHKVGRLLVPLAMVLMVVANAFLLNSPFYRLTWLLQMLFYALVPLGAIPQLPPTVLRLPYYFTMINAAAFVGMFHVLRGNRALAWKRD